VLLLVRLRTTRQVITRGRISASAKAALGLEIVLSYVEVRWRMSRSDIRKTVRQIRQTPSDTRSASRPLSASEEQRTAIRLGRVVDRTLRVLPTDSRCLAQALVLTKMLSARSIDTTLVLGTHSRPTFIAHAWVEHAGVPVQSPLDFADSRLLEL
jgi:hypothetical protein